VWGRGKNTIHVLNLGTFCMYVGGQLYALISFILFDSHSM